MSETDSINSSNDKIKKTLHVEIVTPYELFYEGDVYQLILPAIDGEIGIRAGHSPVIIALNPGELRMTEKSGKELYISISDGYAEIEVDNAIVVIGSAEWPEQIDLSRVKLALDRANQRIADPKSGPREIMRSKKGIMRANARIKVAGRIKKPDSKS
ncbi:MAG: ATP synthase F1 subunit epsilon [Saccharofermentanales bacterium]